MSFFFPLYDSLSPIFFWPFVLPSICCCTSCVFSFYDLVSVLSLLFIFVHPLTSLSSGVFIFRSLDEQTLEGDGDGDVFSGKKTLGDLSAAKNKDGEELDDERQLLMLQKELQGDRGDAARWGVAEVCSGERGGEGRGRGGGEGGMKRRAAYQVSVGCCAGHKCRCDWRMTGQVQSASVTHSTHADTAHLA